eukprot:ctg_3319.g619
MGVCKEWSQREERGEEGHARVDDSAWSLKKDESPPPRQRQSRGTQDQLPNGHAGSSGGAGMACHLRPSAAEMDRMKMSRNEAIRDMAWATQKRRCAGGQRVGGIRSGRRAAARPHR